MSLSNSVRRSLLSSKCTRILESKISAAPAHHFRGCRHNSNWQAQRSRDRSAIGVFSPASAVLFLVGGAGLWWYFTSEKERLQRKKQEEMKSTQYGRAHVGGPFALITHQGKPFTEQDLLGRWSLVYFGFTHCPDICPAELDKMGEIVNQLEKDPVLEPLLQPIFVTVDPARDPPRQVERYLGSFHPKFIALTGEFEKIKSMCKAYRVYFSTPPNADPKGDYLVDHSIFVYLMDPRGEFVEAFGQSTTVPEVVERARKEVAEYNGGGSKP